MKNFSSLKCLFLLSLLVLSACASGPELEHYSRSEIDRPYTLPKGVATWHVPIIYTEFHDQSNSVSFGPVPIPLLWETSLSDDWNLIWVPLPLGVSHQFVMNEQNRIGFSLMNGFAYSSVSGFRIRPTLSLSYRRFLTKQLALEFIPSYSADIPFQSGENYRWSSGFSAGPLFQLSEFFSLKPLLSFEFGRGPVGLISSSDADFDQNDETYASMGAGISAAWSIGRQWDLRPDYHYTDFATQAGYRSHVAVLEFVHFW